ncbi:hypothetical protein Brsp05_04032 [Brucella sp. NBRC 12953]|uniref:hypothetical protein n=1 Tax=Brucella sp. NBRC 12953 TaxID=3075481 RepID=UPI0030A528B8
MVRDEIKHPSGAHINIQKGEGNAPVKAYIAALPGSNVERLFAWKGADRDPKILTGNQMIGLIILNFDRNFFLKTNREMDNVVS